jgi:hypothetical protein
MPVAVSHAEDVAWTLASIELFRLTGRHTAILFSGKARRAATDTIADRSIPAVGMSVILMAIVQSVTVSMSVVWLCSGRSSQAQGQDSNRDG